eukprot:TRINITY_DN14751_c0_g1_i1.p1 TRINITY_DN14751_c0_g1~~TRINITY_DN14751_c0_g1_i1.p1  ORF type:complete len:116 (+),score=7.83 TRINITY_DN14751_c0_g1_i1:138-485(+)
MNIAKGVIEANTSAFIQEQLKRRQSPFNRKLQELWNHTTASNLFMLGSEINAKEFPLNKHMSSMNKSDISTKKNFLVDKRLSLPFPERLKESLSTSIGSTTVSYTHLTLPTNREV